MQGKNLKEHLGTIGLPKSGTKCMLIDRLNKVLNDNLVAVSPEKLEVPLPVPKSRNDPSNNRTRCPRQGEAAHTKTEWIPLELYETKTTTVEKDFASCNPTNKNATDNSFVQRNKFSNSHDRKSFSRTRRKNQM